MKPIKRKLQLDRQTIRTLRPAELAGVVGGIGSERGGMCSTEADTGCTPSANDVCTSVANCITNACATNPC